MAKIPSPVSAGEHRQEQGLQGTPANGVWCTVQRRNRTQVVKLSGTEFRRRLRAGEALGPLVEETVYALPCAFLLMGLHGVAGSGHPRMVRFQVGGCHLRVDKKCRRCRFTDRFTVRFTVVSGVFQVDILRKAGDSAFCA